MDPVSALTLVQLSGSILLSCYQYIGKARTAPGDITKIINEINSLKGILEHLAPLVGGIDEQGSSSLKSLHGPDGPFYSCSLVLKDLEKKLKTLNEASNIRKRLQWPFESSKLDETIGKLEKHKTTFILALAGDSYQIDIKTKVMLDDMKIEAHRKEVLAWLKGADPTTNYNAARRKHEPHTGDWLLQSDTFKLWSKEHAQILWLSGIPGAGKTILSSTVVEQLVNISGDQLESRVVFYYFDFNDQAKQTLSGCLRSFIQQLSTQSTTLDESLLLLYEDYNSGEPNNDDLTEVLISILSKTSKTYMVIDALDECGEDERESVCEMLSAIKSSTARCMIFITSRPEPDIKRGLTPICQFVLDMGKDLVDEDIRSHVRSRLMKDVKWKRWPQPIKEEIEDKLTSGANGMFRWAVCQLDVLRKCLKLQDIRKTLGKLPETLSETYERIFKAIPFNYQNEMRTILLVLAYSTRPMSIQEVAEASAVNIWKQSFDTDDRFQDPYDILELCSSLVSLAELGHESQSALKKERRFVNWTEDVKILQFSHFSVKEYILTEKSQQTFSLLESQSLVDSHYHHLYLTELCLIYLLDFNGGERACEFKHDEFPLLAYAALHWTEHWKAGPIAATKSLENLLTRLFDPNHPNNFMNWLNLYDPATTRVMMDIYGDGTRSLAWGVNRNKQDFMPPLYYACHYGSSQLAAWLLRSDAAVAPSKNDLSLAMAGAAWGGCCDMVQLLLDKGADPNGGRAGKFSSPLHAAVENGDPATIALLLDAGADPNVSLGEVGTALHVAAGKGHLKAIVVLLDHGADIDSWTKMYGTPLTQAAQNGQDEAIALLVKRGAKVNIRGGGYDNALKAACEFASFDSVKLLLEAGALVNREEEETSPLYQAALRGELDTMRLLISRGADLNVNGGIYGSPLQSSIQSRNYESFKLMLESGADINYQGGYCGSAVGQAIFARQLDMVDKLLSMGAIFTDAAIIEAIESTLGLIVQTLLNRGANPNTEHDRYGNILQLAVEWRSEEIVGYLLDSGADVNAIEGEHGTALQAAAGLGEEGIVRMLLHHGADVNLSPASGRWGFALQAAIMNNQEAIINLILQEGADVNANGGENGNPLQAAAFTKQEELVQRLLKLGADVNLPGGQYGTALRAALASGDESITKILLDHGADANINIKDSYTTDPNPFLRGRGSALEAAAVSENLRLVQMLLERGADINALGESNESALIVAASNPEPAILSFLLKNGADVKRDGGSALINAINECRIECVKMLLEKGVDVNSNPSGHGSGLRFCIGHRKYFPEQEKMMQILLEAGADVNIQGGEWCGTALQEAIDCGIPSVVADILKRNPDVNIVAGKRGSALIVAICNGDEEVFRTLLERGADVNISGAGQCGTALHAAIHSDYYDMAQELLDRGANVNTPGLYASPLITASGYGKAGQLELITRLIAMGANLEAVDDIPGRYSATDMATYRVNPGDSWSRGSALQMAAYAGNERVARYLLGLGADVNSSSGQYGNPLQAAVVEGNTAMAKLLLDSGANVNALGGEWGTALQAAALSGNGGHDALVDLLLAADADVNLEGGYNGSPLQAVSRSGKLRHVKLFLERGARVNICAGVCGSPLAAAAKKGNYDVVELLLAHGADVNLAGGKYGFPLQAAACESQARLNGILELLLKKGADVHARGGKYETALQAAAYHKRAHVEVLLRHGADVNMKGGKFGSALGAARAKGLGRVVKLLLDHGAVDD